jgi:ABC-type ATPase with predicted acetyltransferase domain
VAEETDDASTGGDAACWLPRVCKECGALVEAELPAECWRCGAMVLSVGYSDSN